MFYNDMCIQYTAHQSRNIIKNYIKMNLLVERHCHLVACRDPDPRILQTIRGSVVTCAKLSEPRSDGYRDALLLLSYESNHVYVYTDPVPSSTLSDVPRI